MRLSEVTRRSVEALRQDLAYAARDLMRSPGLTATIVITLGLGVGANAAVFTVLDRVLLQPPPGVAEPESLRRLYAHRVSVDAPEYGPGGQVSPFLATRDLIDLGEAARGLARIEADYLDRGELIFPEKRPARLTFVSPGYFETLGIRIQRGRAFAVEESRLPGPVPPTAVISDALWKTRFGGDDGVVGKVIHVGETQYAIVGVAGPGFQGLELDGVDLWVPLANLANGNITSLRAIARLNDGTDVQLLEARLSMQYRASHPGDRIIGEGSGILVGSIHSARGPELTGVSVARVVGMPERSIALLLRLGGVGIVVLLIAVANVASLLLMRAFRRQREIAVRLALGVSRARLVAQHLIESILLATFAGGVGLAIASFTGRLLRTELGPGVKWTDSVVDVRVAIVTMVIATAAGCVASMAPLFLALNRDVAASLKPFSAALGRAGSKLRSGLLITQTALCMALLASAGVFLQSLRRAGEADRGFDADRTLLVSVPAAYASSESDLLRIRDAIRSLPGIEAVGRSLTGLSAFGLRGKVGLSASDTIGVNPRGPWLDFVDADWGRAAGVRLIGGRMLDSSHTFGYHAVVNEAMARALFRGRNGAGSCIRIREPGGSCREVVGVIRDVRWSLSAESPQRIYLPIEQSWSRPPVALVPNYLVVRTRASATSADVAQIRDLIAPLSPDKDRTSTRRVADMLQAELRPWRLATTLFLILGALGLTAAAAGIYGLIAYGVSQRTRELGIRIALGATRSNILRLVVGSGLRTVLVGTGVGIIAALLAGQAMASLLYDTSAYDTTVLAGTVLMLIVVSICASIVPALGATRVNPSEALAAE